MISNRPYLLRAFYDWIVDSGKTPILVLDAHNPKCQIPQEYIEGDEIVFNVSPVAVRDFQISNDKVHFKASFSGLIHMISAPIKAALAIYAEENGEGLFFDAEEDDDVADSPVPLKSIDGGIKDAPRGDASPIVGDAVKQKEKPTLTLVE